MADLPETFSLTVHSLTGTIFTGTVCAVTATNEQGVFDVLPIHTNFISLIENELTVLLPNQTTRTIPVTTGVLRCSNGVTDVYLGLESAG